MTILPNAAIVSFDVLRSLIKSSRPDLVKQYRRSAVKKTLFATPYLMRNLDKVDSALPMVHLFEHRPELLIELMRVRSLSIVRSAAVTVNYDVLIYTDISGSGIEPVSLNNPFSWEELFSFGKTDYRTASVDAGVLLGLDVDVATALADNDDSVSEDFIYEPMLALAVFHLNPSLSMAVKLRQIFEAYRYEWSVGSSVNIYDLFSKGNVDSYTQLAVSSGGVIEDASLWLFIAAVTGGSRQDVFKAVSSSIDPVETVIRWMQGFSFGDAVEMMVNDIDVELAAHVFEPREGGFLFLSDLQ